MAKKVTEIVFEATKTMSNLKNHDFSVADYKMCSKEADVVIRALQKYIDEINFDGLDVVSFMEKNTTDKWDEVMKCFHTMESAR